ncbi:MAG: serine protease [Betaproteobacteria bacterium]
MRTRRSPFAIPVLLGSLAFALPLWLIASSAAGQDPMATIERVKGSIVAVGTVERSRTPPFEFRGTGFVVGDGTFVVTNAHVLPGVLDSTRLEVLGILIPSPDPAKVAFREAKQVAVDPGSDLAILKISGAPLPALVVRNSDGVKEGQPVMFTGFPIGTAIGLFPATHRGMISAITPIAIPKSRSAELDPKTIRRLTSGAFPIFQLDATAYPGNSGSPVFDPATGDVLGIINMVFVKGTKESALSQPSGITYAVPSKYLQDLLQKAR